MIVSRVCFACNDPDNGQFTGKAEFIEIDFNNDFILDCRLHGGDIKIVANKGVNAVKIGRLTLPIRTYQSWAGNWCWDSATVEVKDSVRLFNYLCKLKHWHCEEAPEQLYGAFNDRTGITVGLVRKMVDNNAAD